MLSNTNSIKRILIIVFFFLASNNFVSACECECYAGSVRSRTTIFAVGSEAVYPFSAYLSEYLGASTEYAIPMVAMMNTSTGIDEFIQNSNVDIVNAARRMTAEEYAAGISNGTGDLLELGFGYDGIVFACHKTNNNYNLTLEQIFMALVKEIPRDGKLVPNPYKKWNQINPDLPAVDISFYAPDEMSSAFTTLQALIISEVASRYVEYRNSIPEIRDDGVYNSFAENEAKIVHEIMKRRAGIGIINYSFLENGREYLAGVRVNGVSPDRKNIAEGSYPLSRKLYMYLKVDHFGRISGLQEFFNLLLSAKSIGRGGALEGLGLITLSPQEYKDVVAKWQSRAVLQAGDL